MTESEKKDKLAEYHKKWYEANRDRIRNRQRQYDSENREARLIRQKEWYLKNKDAHLAKCRKRRIENPETEKARYEKNKDRILLRNKTYRENNRGVVSASKAKRRSQKLKATPKWMTKEDFAAVQEWYQLAKDLQWLSEEKLHVDHIVPLLGKDVCGLHIAANLQILPASENLRKKNKHG